MKKKSIAARLGIAAMALTLVTTSLMSGTLAKYTTTKNFTASAIIARWNPSVAVDTKDGKTQVTDDMVLSFRDLVTSGDPGSKVASGVIAPGMSGKIPVIINMVGGKDGGTKTTQVATDVKVYVSLTDDSVSISNLKFYSKPDYSGTPIVPTAIDPQNNPNGYELLTDTIPANSAGDKTAALYWRWQYDDTENDPDANAADTSNAMNFSESSDSLTSKIQFKVVLTQANPYPTASSSAS